MYGMWIWRIAMLVTRHEVNKIWKQTSKRNCVRSKTFPVKLILSTSLYDVQNDN